jgi:hypothetical protein
MNAADYIETERSLALELIAARTVASVTELAALVHAIKAMVPATMANQSDMASAGVRAAMAERALDSVKQLYKIIGCE